MTDRPRDDDEDALLAALGALTREQEGELDALPDDPALAPLDPAEADAMFAAAFGAMSAPAAAPELPAPIPFPERKAQAPEREAQAPERKAPARRRQTAWWAGGAIAAAAALVLAVLTFTGPPPLPDYALVAGAGEQTLRADPPSTPTARARYSPGARIHLVARPVTDVTDPVVARLYLRRDGQDTLLNAPLQISAKGGVCLDAVAGESLVLPEGEGALVLLVRPADLKTDDADLLRADDPAPARRLVHDFRFSTSTR